MILALFFLSFFANTEESAAERPITITLTSPVTDQFENWTLRLDTEQLYTFDDSGRLGMTIPVDSKSFEVIDPKKAVRFFGLWRHYPETVAIQVGANVMVHEVVTANRSSQSSWEVSGELNVVRPDEQPERSMTQTSDLLKETAEISLQKTNLGGGSPIMRGMSGNRILLMVDGFRLNNAIYRLGLNQYLNTVAGSQLEQIEVLSGPSGVQYGSDGLGGTVHMRSVDPAVNEGSNAIYDGFYSSADGTNSHQLSGYTGNEQFFVQGHFKLNDYEDLEAGGDVGQQLFTGYSAWDASLNLTWKIDETRRLRLINSNSDAEHVPRTDRMVSGRDLLWEYSPQKLRLHGLRYEHQLDRGFADFMDLGLGYLRHDEGTRRISASKPNRLLEDRTLVNTWQINGTFTRVTQRVDYTYGFDTQWDEVEGDAFEFLNGSTSGNPMDTKFPNGSKYSSSGLFGVAEVHLTGAQDLRIGLRQAWITIDASLEEPIGKVNPTFDQLTPSLTWAVDRDHFFYSLGISQGFRAPNLEDSLSVGPSNQGFDAPNPNLEPEELWSYEANLRLRNENSMFMASLYSSRFTSLIERVPGSWQGSATYEGEPVFILDNVGHARVDGVSVTFERQFGSYNTLEMDGSWVYGTQTDTDEPMTRIPPLRGDAAWAFQKNKLRLVGALLWAVRQDRLSPNDLGDSRIPAGGTPGYTVGHLRGHYVLTENFTLKLSLENLTNELYKSHGSGIYEPGRRVLVGLEARWK